MAVIAVDLTPMRPGGDNGGVKILILELLRSFQNADPDLRFILLMASWNHQELSDLDGPNFERLCVLHQSQRNGKKYAQFLPERFHSILLRIRRRLGLVGFFRPRDRSSRRSLVSRGVDLLFCPFTAPTFYEPGIPLISIVHDLQHVDYPQFFSSAEIESRNDFMSDMCRKAHWVVCISENVRQSVIKNLKVESNKVQTIHNCIQFRFRNDVSSQLANKLEELGLNKKNYMYYPANFWPHKNHKMLFTALGMYLHQNPDNPIDLVLTGALKDLEQELKRTVQRMGLTDNVHFLGFLPHQDVEMVWKGCRFLIFPSLYEGFGIPILEAMSMGKPVLCSNVTSLPEIAGNAALYFDPRKPVEIVRCMERIVFESSLEDKLIQLGHRRVNEFDSQKMTHKYLSLFYTSIKASNCIKTAISGVFEDGWTQQEVKITFGPAPKDRLLEAVFFAPHHLPTKTVRLVLKNTKKILQKIIINRGHTIAIHQLINSNQKGSMTFIVHPTFRPKDFNMGNDDRNIGIQCLNCFISYKKGSTVSVNRGNE